MRRLIPFLLLPTILNAQGMAGFFNRNRIVAAEVTSDGALVAYSQLTADTEADRYLDQVFVMSLDGGDPWLLGRGTRARFAPKGEAIAWLQHIDGNYQLVVRDSLAAQDRILSALPNGVTSFAWSPSGRSLVFAGDASQRSATGHRYDNGDFNARQALYHVELADGPVRRLTDSTFALGPANPELPWLVEFDWLTDTTLIVSGRVRGEMSDPEAASLYLVSVNTGTISYLMGKGGRWHTPVVSPNRDWIAFAGQPVGAGPWAAAELMVVKSDGSDLKRLTVGLDRDVHDIHWAANSRQIWFAAEERGARNIRSVDRGNGKFGPETSGNHLLALQDIPDKGNWALAIQTSANSAGSLLRFPLDKPYQLDILARPDSATDELHSGEFEEFAFRARDGTNLFGRLIRPANFDQSKKYPLLVVAHGGPHASAGAGYAPFALAHAATGRVVLSVNARGSTGFGFDVANGLSRQWPGQDVVDLQDAIKAVLAMGIVDSQQISVIGYGAGGVVAERLRQTEPLIKAAVLRCTGADWLAGSGIPDTPLWSEWVAARPFVQPMTLWFARSPIDQVADSHVPLLITEGSASQLGGLDFGPLLFGVANRAGISATFLRLGGSCSSAGPATQLGIFNTEDRWLRR